MRNHFTSFLTSPILKFKIESGITWNFCTCLSFAKALRKYLQNYFLQKSTIFQYKCKSLVSDPFLKSCTIITAYWHSGVKSSTFYLRIFYIKVCSKPNSRQRKAAQFAFVLKNAHKMLMKLTFWKVQATTTY